MQRISRHPIKLVNIYLIHENCWSKYYLEDDLVKILDLIPYPDKNLLRVSAIVSGKGYRTISKLKSEGKIENIYNIYNFKNGILVDLAREYDNSILSVIRKNNGVVLNSMKFSGGEIWNLLVYEYKVNRLLNEIKEFAQIEKVEVNDDIPIDEITDREFKILSIAYDLGYFDYPRKIKSDELARTIGIKQSTLIYHLRKAENRIIGYFIKKVKKDLL